MFTAPPALHAHDLNAGAARPPLRRRLSAAVATAALVLAGLALAPVAPASAAPMITNATALAHAFSGGGVVTLESSFAVEAADRPIAVPTGSSVTLDLNGHILSVAGAYSMAGIRVPEGASLTIIDSHSGGAVTATGGDKGAGIGNNSGEHAGTVTIEGGTVTAIGGEEGAGIGSLAQSGSTVTITGGSVAATGGRLAAGIGSGYLGDGGSVSITGGTVSATGGDGGAGIGGGYLGDGRIVTITGGTVAATGGHQAAGIGGGYSSRHGGTVTITGGTVTATGGTEAAGIGGGHASASGALVTIGQHGIVTAASGVGALSAIGAARIDRDFGSLSNAGTLTIPAGSTLAIPSAATAENSGILNIAGTATGDGTLANTGTIVNTGTITPETLVTINNFVVTFAETHAPDISTPVRVYASTLDAAQIALPAAPTRTGYTFAGWRTAATGGTEWTAATPITGSLTVHALWAAEPRTVTFDSNGGGSIAPITTGYGSTITAPTNPTRTGHAFTGWFADAATTAFDFATPITENVALTAQWSVIAPPIVPPANTTPAQTVTAGDTVTVSGTGFAAGQQLQLWLHSDPVRLGTLTAGADGTVSSRVTIPANTPAGEHLLVLIGADGIEYSSDTITVNAASVTPAPSPSPSPDPTPRPATPAATALPATGADPALPVGLALVLILAGAALSFGRAHRARTR